MGPQVAGLCSHGDLGSRACFTQCFRSQQSNPAKQITFRPPRRMAHAAKAALAQAPAPVSTAKQPHGRLFNFSAGPAVLPVPVLEQAQAELLNWQVCAAFGIPGCSDKRCSRGLRCLLHGPWVCSPASWCAVRRVYGVDMPQKGTFCHDVWRA